MTSIYRVQYWHGKQWKKTFFGTNYHNEMYHFVSLEDAKKELDKHHKYEKEVKKLKKLTKYRIVQIIFEEIVHELP